MNDAICCVPVSPLRLEPSHRSEMVSQLLFGEACKVIQTGDEHWVKVQCRYDGYEGWCQERQLQFIENDLDDSATKLVTAGWSNEILFDGNTMMVPYGSPLPQFENGKATWGKHTLTFNGPTFELKTGESSKAQIESIARMFLNTAYLWGGKSVFGIDCSGFVQSVFRFLGVPLLRDAYQQAEQGKEIHGLKDALCGDLAFFNNPAGRITHVGLLLNDRTIIHSSVSVRIDHIDEQGIINSDTSERTHQLKIIKRYW